MSKRTVKVTLELVYEDGEFDPVKMAKLDLKDVPWRTMVAKQVKVTDLRQVTSERNEPCLTGKL